MPASAPATASAATATATAILRMGGRGGEQAEHQNQSEALGRQPGAQP